MERKPTTKKAGLVPRLVLCPASVADPVFLVFVVARPRLLLLADLALRRIRAFLVGTDPADARERSLEAYARLLVAIDDRPASELV